MNTDKTKKDEIGNRFLAKISPFIGGGLPCVVCKGTCQRVSSGIVIHEICEDIETAALSEDELKN